jgi:hypothetical protein
MIYDDAGQMTSAQLISHPADIVDVCYWHDAAMHASISYRQYQAAGRGPLQPTSP